MIEPYLDFPTERYTSPVGQRTGKARSYQKASSPARWKPAESSVKDAKYDGDQKKPPAKQRDSSSLGIDAPLGSIGRFPEKSDKWIASRSEKATTSEYPLPSPDNSDAALRVKDVIATGKTVSGFPFNTARSYVETKTGDSKLTTARVPAGTLEGATQMNNEANTEEIGDGTSMDSIVPWTVKGVDTYLPKTSPPYDDHLALSRLDSQIESWAMIQHAGIEPMPNTPEASQAMSQDNVAPASRGDTLAENQVSNAGTIVHNMQPLTPATDKSLALTRSFTRSSRPAAKALSADGDTINFVHAKDNTTSRSGRSAASYGDMSAILKEPLEQWDPQFDTELDAAISPADSMHQSIPTTIPFARSPLRADPQRAFRYCTGSSSSPSSLHAGVPPCRERQQQHQQRSRREPQGKKEAL